MDQPDKEITLKKNSFFRIMMIVLVVIVVIAAVAAAYMFFWKKSDSSTNSSVNNNRTNAAATNRQFNTGAGGTVADADHDGLSDAEEATLGTNPTDADTDHDGLSDFDEVKKYHTNPKSAHSGTLAITDGQAVAQGIDPLTGNKLFATVPPANVNK